MARRRSLVGAFLAKAHRVQMVEGSSPELNLVAEVLERLSGCDDFQFVEAISARGDAPVFVRLLGLLWRFS